VTIERVGPVEGAEAKVRVVVRGAGGEDAVEGSHLLVAAGRSASVDGLGLEHAGIAYDGGRIVVDERLKTRNRRVYAIGDAAGRGQFTHVAGYHAGLVVRSALFRLCAKVNADILPRVTFTDPELAHVGLDETEARARGLAPRVVRWPYHENDRAQAERETVGHIKVVTDGKGVILGATIVGSGAGELITTWSLALSQGLNIRAFVGMIVPYPTLAEIGKRAAIAYFTPTLSSNWVRRFIRLLRLLG
jgi:pyruvate/2-oxoglutarate dehydrogenase complex dihydrolipoamide dehydrogenase (E3) component